MLLKGSSRSTARSSSEPSFSASLASISEILSANLARSSSSSEVATSASTVRPLSDTSARPPSTMIFGWVPPDVTVRIPGRIAATTGACPASTPKSPSTPGTSTWSTSPEKASFSGETRSKWKVAIGEAYRFESVSGEWRIANRHSLFAIRSSRRFGRELLALFDRLFDGADHVERRLRQLIVLALAKPAEALDGVGEVDELAGRSGEDFGDMERLRQETLDLARARHRDLVLFGQLVHAENGDDILQRLVTLQHLLNHARGLVMLLADDERGEHARRRVERVHRRIDAFFRNRAVQNGGGVQMRERGGRRRVGQVVGRHIDRLHRGDRALVGGGDAFLQRAHVGGERRLIAHRRRDTAEQRGDFRAGLRETEDVVDEEQHVLALIAEMLGHGETGEADAGAGARRLVHLPEHERAFRLDAGIGMTRVGIHLGFDELVIQVVAFAGPFADAGEYRITAMRLGDVVDQFLNQHGLADAGATEQADLAALGIRRQQVDDLDAGDENFRFGRLVGVGRRLLMDRTQALRDHRTGFVDRLADHVHDAAERSGADRNPDRRAGVADLLAADQTFGGIHRNGAHRGFAEMLRDLEHQAIAAVLGLDRVQNGRQMSFELHVDDGADDLRDASGLVGGCSHENPLLRILQSQTTVSLTGILPLVAF